MRFGLTILPEIPWAEAAPRWRAAEDLGFDHAWTYDHLVWGGLPESPWFGTTPTLTAAALVTSTVRLGTFVSSPNFRHPVTFHRDVQSLDDISGGRFLLGVGAGGDLDARILGGPELSVKERVDRFQEFVDLLVRLRTEDHVTSDGTWFSSYDARTLPPLHDVPLVVAGNGPRSVRFAARRGDALGDHRAAGPRRSTHGSTRWRRRPGCSRRRCPPPVASRAGSTATSTSTPRRTSPWRAPRVFAELTGRAAELGFTDVITHWPRPDSPYAGDEATLEAVASDVLPTFR